MMNACRRNIILSLLLLISSNACLQGQEPDVYGIIDSVRLKLDRIEDYQAGIEVTVDVDFINMPVKHATILYKRPDKVKFISDDFLMLPKRGLGKRMTEILEEPYTAIYLGTDTLNKTQQHVIRIVPLSRKPEVIMATWWVNTKSYQVEKNESNLKKGGNITIHFSYDDKQDILPQEMVFYFEVERISIPLKFIGKAQGIETDKLNAEGSTQGRVYIRFTGYRINTGIDDEVFR